MEDGEVAVCLAAGTKVLTQKGYQNIENISDNDRVFIPYDNDVDLNSDPRLESAALIRNGLKPVYEITLNGGSSIQATDNHKFLIKESRDFRLKQNKMVWKELKELQPGDKIMSPENNMVHDHTFVLNSEYLTAGWLLGDGWQLESGTWGVCFGSTETHAMNIVMTQIAKWYENTPISKFGYHKNAFRLTSNNRKACYQWQTQKKEYIKFLIEKFGFKPAKSIHKIVPNNIWHAEANEKANFLSGLFSADGTAFLERDRPKVSLASSSKQLLGEVQLLLSEFGIKSRLKWNLIKGRNRYQGSLGIGNNDNVLKFKKYIGFNLSPSKQNVLNQTMAEYKIDSSLRDYHTIESIRYLGIRPVYDLNIPNGHHFVANGVVVHNCNLGSINLAKYVTKDGKFDIAKIKRNVPIAVKFLDKVIDRNYYPITEASNSNKKWRPVGLGVMGWQDLLFKLRIPFESDQAATIAANIQEEIYYWALKTSMELAKEHGAHENFKKTHAAQGKLQFDFNSRVSLHNEERWTELKTEIKKHGLRNSLLIAIAPTATIGQICGSTECIEPQVSNIFKRETLSGEFITTNQYLVEDLKKLNLWNQTMLDKIKMAEGSIQHIAEIPEEIRALYKTAWEIKQKALIDQAVARGAFIDQSQSLNLFMSQPSLETMSSMYFYAWKNGIKTTYYLRSKPASRIQKIMETAGPVETVSDLENPEICESCQ
jgi:ribonucleoside-diphosphate reductase alpha chain